MDTPHLRPHPDHGSDPGNYEAPAEAEACVQELKSALSLHGITLPSLNVDLITFSGAYPPHLPGLVALGRCNLRTARLLTTVLRAAAAE
ncbi:hypothetical protein HUT18_20765 [Streptomyces sp. NA04227]|uniref:hypothetical protein n=1 Tax=Streptomyces sp. NA04227 TaxID=2742136 RepID=UPI0015927D17|nr:hypothetical protein [Streptomyces sp. NA04227]QKW04968.1 hypothetical protein HUT18_20765 [Streptomyces sp. NA04227]